MRVVAGSEPSKDLRCAELDRHLEFITEFVARAERGGEEPSLTLILRSAASSAAQALIGMGELLLRAGISARAVLATLEPDEDLRQFYASLSELSPREPAKALIRWARNPRLLDAHEQATYGASMCWSGDAMRRDADKRNALSLFEAEAPESVRLGRLAFAALWGASSVVSERRLTGCDLGRPSGAYEIDPARLVTLSRFRPRQQGWPLVRH
jgi:hypothetical protein